MVIEGEEQYVITIIMAAGKGTRMKSKNSKLKINKNPPDAVWRVSIHHHLSPSAAGG